MVLADSYKVSRAPYYLGYSQRLKPFAYRTVTVYGGPFQSTSTRFLPFIMESRNPYMTCVI